MKAIIDGKRYNTETAEEVASWSNGCGYGDFNRCEESLYKTKSGAFFLHGSGGARSAYSTSSEGGRTLGGGSAIRPMTREEAIGWLESHDEPEAIEKHFADAVVDA